MKPASLLLLATALLAPPLLASAPRPAQAAGQVGELAPDFTLTGLDGGTYTLSALRGKVVFLNLLGYN